MRRQLFALTFVALPLAVLCSRDIRLQAHTRSRAKRAPRRPV